MASFDIVSEINMQEVDNAINQAQKELQNRYDLKGCDPQIIWDGKVLTLSAKEQDKLAVVKDILQSKMHKRGIDISALKFDTPTPAGGMTMKQKVDLIQGIDREVAKDICKKIRDSKLKVQAQISEDKIKVTSESRDALQATIQLVRTGGFKIPLQFTNMRS